MCWDGEGDAAIRRCLSAGPGRFWVAALPLASSLRGDVAAMGFPRWVAGRVLPRQPQGRGLWDARVVLWRVGVGYFSGGML